MMISFQDISRTYRLDGQSGLTPVRGVNLNIDRGEFVLLIGRSGSGKTTLLNLAAGLIKPTAGRILVKDTDIRDLTDRQLSSLRAGTIGFVFQFPSLIPSLNLLENTTLASSFSPRFSKAAARERAIGLLGKMGLSHRTGALPRQLSAGEQKRAVLARALMNEPEILLADEPTSDLDEQTEREIIAVLRDLNSAGTTILMVTHNTDLVSLSNRALKLEDGKLVSITAG